VKPCGFVRKIPLANDSLTSPQVVNLDHRAGLRANVLRYWNIRTGMHSFKFESIKSAN